MLSVNAVLRHWIDLSYCDSTLNNLSLIFVYVEALFPYPKDKHHKAHVHFVLAMLVQLAANKLFLPMSDLQFPVNVCQEP